MKELFWRLRFGIFSESWKSNVEQKCAFEIRNVEKKKTFHCILHTALFYASARAKEKLARVLKNHRVYDWVYEFSRPLMVLLKRINGLFSNGLNRNPLHRVYRFFAIVSIRKAFSPETWNGLIFGWTQSRPLISLVSYTFWRSCFSITMRPFGVWNETIFEMKPVKVSSGNKSVSIETLNDLIILAGKPDPLRTSTGT